jgi:hypothetical protein
MAARGPGRTYGGDELEQRVHEQRVRYFSSEGETIRTGGAGTSSASSASTAGSRLAHATPVLSQTRAFAHMSRVTLGKPFTTA